MDIQSEKLDLVRLIIETNNEAVLKKVMSLLSSSKKTSISDSEYLASSEKMKEALDKSINQINEGKVKSILLDEIWR